MNKEYVNIVSNYSSQLPNLADAFATVAAIEPSERMLWAKQQRSQIMRDGWFINTPVTAQGDGETVQQHVEHLTQLIDDYFPDYHKVLAKSYAECHDDQEVIAHAVIKGIKRDLNPRFNKESYKISDDDKEAIELAAVDLLFEAAPATKAIWNSYKSADNETAAMFTGIDKICVMWRCVDFVESGKYSYGDFQAYWDYWTPQTVEKKLHGLISDTYKGKLYPRIEKLKPKL